MENFDFKDFRNFAKSVNCSKSVLDDYSKKSNIVLPQMSYVNPSIVEEREMHAVTMDVFSRLMMDRSIFFGTEVNSDVCNIVIAQLLYLASTSEEPITMYVNSPGGSVYDGYGILDTMRYIKPKVKTLCTGMAASMGAMILMCGSRGDRSMLPLSRCMIHQPLGGAKGQATEIEIEYKEIIKLRKELYEIIAQRSGQKLSKIEKDCERDFWMTAEETKKYGLIDNIVQANWD